MKVTLRLQWIPGHCEDVRNDAANWLAKEAAKPGKTHLLRPLLSRKKVLIRSKSHAQWDQEWKESTKDAHLRKFDGNLPARYTRQL